MKKSGPLKDVSDKWNALPHNQWIAQQWNGLMGKPEASHEPTTTSHDHHATPQKSDLHEHQSPPPKLMLLNMNSTLSNLIKIVKIQNMTILWQL